MVCVGGGGGGGRLSVFFEALFVSTSVLNAWTDASY